MINKQIKSQQSRTVAAHQVLNALPLLALLMHTQVCFGEGQIYYGKEDGTISVYGTEGGKVLSTIPLPESLAGQIYIGTHLTNIYTY